MPTYTRINCVNQLPNKEHLYSDQIELSITKGQSRYQTKLLSHQATITPTIIPPHEFEYPKNKR